MELLSPRAKRALDRLTVLAAGNRLLVFDALARYERGEIHDLVGYIRNGGQEPAPATASTASDATRSVKKQ